ncbi:MAG: hypothetical protein HC828_10995 [Blastochloris sp.]|nr:hypothetical protein [Blastochloris sp.]
MNSQLPRHTSPLGRAQAVVGLYAALGLLNNPYGFAPTEMQLVRSIAAQAAAKLENLLLHQEMLGRARLQTEMELATEAQLNLLPQSPPYVCGASISLPCRARPCKWAATSTILSTNRAGPLSFRWAMWPEKACRLPC